MLTLILSSGALSVNYVNGTCKVEKDSIPYQKPIKYTCMNA